MSSGHKIAVGPTGFAASAVPALRALAFADVTNGACARQAMVAMRALVHRGQKLEEIPLSGADATTDFGAVKAVPAANGDDTFAFVWPDRSLVAAVRAADGAVEWAVSFTVGQPMAMHVALLNPTTAIVRVDNGCAWLVDAEDRRVPPVVTRLDDAFGAGLVAAVSAIDGDMFAVLTKTKLMVASVNEDRDGVDVAAEYPLMTPSPVDPGTVVIDGLAVFPTVAGGAPAFATLRRGGNAVVHAGNGAEVATVPRCSAAVALSDTTLALATVGGADPIVRLVRVAPGAGDAAATAAKPKRKDREAAAAAAATLQGEVATLDVALPAARIGDTITGLAVNPEGTMLLVVGPIGYSGVGAATLPLNAAAEALAAVLPEDPAEDAGTLWGALATLAHPAGGLVAVGDGTSAGKAEATLDYACLCKPLQSNPNGPPGPVLVSAATATHAAHTRRARERREWLALAELLRWNTRLASRMPQGAPVQWNHGALRQAMKQLGASFTARAVVEGCEEARGNRDFVAAVAASANAVGAGVTLQHQLGFRAALPEPRHAGADNTTTPATTVGAHLQFYGMLLGAARSLAGPCTSTAARWDALIADAQRRGAAVRGSSIVAAGLPQAPGGDAANPAKSSRRQRRRAAAEGGNSKAMHLVHSSTLQSTAAARYGGADTIATEQGRLINELPSDLRSPAGPSTSQASKKPAGSSQKAAIAAAAGSFFNPHAPDAAWTPAERAVTGRAAVHGLSTYERLTLGLPREPEQAAAVVHIGGDEDDAKPAR